MKRDSNPSAHRDSKNGVVPIRTVVVATDFSAGSENAIGRTAMLPLAPGASVLLVHVLPKALPVHLAGRIEKGAQDALRKQERALAHSLRRRGAIAGIEDVDVRGVLDRGDARERIVDLGRENAADVIVIGRHGETTLKSMWLGSSAERVVRAGCSSVLVVNTKPKRPYEQPLVAIDLGATTRNTLEAALQMLHDTVEKIPAVYCQPIPYEPFVRTIMKRDELKEYQGDLQREAKEELGAILRDLPSDAVSAVVKVGDPRKVIPKELESRKSDLLVVGTHGRTGAAHALLGSTAETLLKLAPCDVLVARRTT